MHNHHPKHRHGGPPSAGVSVMAIHIALFALFEKWSKLPVMSLTLDDKIGFDLPVGLDLTHEYARTLLIVKIILHCLIASAKRRFGQVPAGAEAIHQKLDAELFKEVAIKEVNSRYPIDLQQAVEDLEGAGMGELVRATHGSNTNGYAS